MLFIQGQPFSVERAQTLAPSTPYSDAIISSMVENPDPFLFAYQDLFKFAVILRSNIVDAAKALSTSHASFETFYRTRGNPSYWTISNEGGLQLRPSVRPSEAIMDISNAGQHYGFECATAMEIVLLTGILKTIGPDGFDQLYANLYLWDWNDVPHLPLTIEPVTQHGVPGDVRYFKNPDVSPQHMAFQGENVIVLPNEQYYGHGIGIGGKAFMISHLNQARRPGAERSAYLMPRATRIVLPALYASTESFLQLPQPTLPV
ncbi:protein-glutamine gamma-glutamyltransferase [Pullulanibacillus pueri]|uniref:Protein-glutamine gamma-glutamyltransferase n=1 Tax=Pullulanibacillus pueri TaxID=1437324 RepID=A0A8J3ELW6_9BACL|nr:protein-glutamine gamma-glutamyltransferase [Pullulanibacillus pueri]MBM7682324.1 protein-glutamine gamma-glutamyltransferase [Pullulanibacillus pueri]GGH80794.1 protein-glutamine gamma-glutamyltransferase [Pullulanibacillus pueri]